MSIVVLSIQRSVVNVLEEVFLGSLLIAFLGVQLWNFEWQ